MFKGNNQESSQIDKNHMVWFFAGAETRNDRFNIFTASFIRLMKNILMDDFDIIRGIFHKSAMMNVIWALNNAQQPLEYPESKNFIRKAFDQIVSYGLAPSTQIIITSSSSGSIIAAQTACYLAKKNKNNVYFEKPFHLVLGASMISSDSELFKQLVHYQKEGTIGEIIHDEVQDVGDNSAGIGGLNKFEAYINAFGLMFPWFSKKFHGPSFLNSHPQKGHIHRKRSKTIQKAIDYVTVILINYKLAGDDYMLKASAVLNEEQGIKQR